MAVLTRPQIKALGRALEELARKQLESSISEERRASPRLPFRQVMRVRCLGGSDPMDTWVPCVSFDVSHLGIGLLSSTCEIPAGCMVLVDCAPDLTERLRIPGVVMRGSCPIPHLWEMGIRFEFVSELLGEAR